MTIQTPETRRTRTCPHCEDWPLAEEPGTGGEKVYVCTNCGCLFSLLAMELLVAGDGCPIAAIEDGR